MKNLDVINKTIYNDIWPVMSRRVNYMTAPAQVKYRHDWIVGRLVLEPIQERVFDPQSAVFTLASERS